MIRGLVVALALVGTAGCGAVRGPSKMAIVNFGKVEGQKALQSCAVTQGQPADEVRSQCGEPRETLRATAHEECWIYDNIAEMSSDASAGSPLVAVCLDSRQKQAYTREGKETVRMEVSRVYGLRAADRKVPSVRTLLPPPPPPPPPAATPSAGEDEDI